MAGLLGKLFIMPPATRFDQWKKADAFEYINDALNQLDCQQASRAAQPSVLCIDSQSVKLYTMICELRDTSGNKRISCCKRT